MRIPPILRAHPRTSLAAVLALILLIGLFWYQSLGAPHYPGAQNLRHETPE